MAGGSLETCWTIVQAAARGDAAARSAFSRTYLTAVRGYLEARWRGRRFASDLDDAVQEVFVECFKVGGALERAAPSKGDFRGLLFAVVRNVARRHEERVVERGHVSPEETAWLARVAEDVAGQATLFDRGWAMALVQEATELHRQRAHAEGHAGRQRIQILERRFGRNEPIRDIAAEWAVPAQDLHNAYRKARKEFYACLKEVVAFHRPGVTDLEGECRSLLAQLG